MSQWADMSRRWNEYGPPCRPSPEDIKNFKKVIKPGKTLLLGVTPELQPLATICVDNDAEVVKIHNANAVIGDWGNLPFGRVFDNVVGDGSLNVFEGKLGGLFEAASKVLKPKGQLVLRIFTSPDYPDTLEQVIKDKDKYGYHAFKWRVAHSIADPFVKVKDLYRIIKPVYPHPTLEFYKDSDATYYFPKVYDLKGWNHISLGHTYELARDCPVVTWTY